MKTLEEKQDDLRQSKWVVSIYAMYVAISVYGAYHNNFASTTGQAEATIAALAGTRGIYQFNLEQCKFTQPRGYQTIVECLVE